MNRPADFEPDKLRDVEDPDTRRSGRTPEPPGAGVDVDGLEPRELEDPRSGRTPGTEDDVDELASRAARSAAVGARLPIFENTRRRMPVAVTTCPATSHGRG